MKQSKTTLKELTHRYRAVLIKCALLNLAAFAVALPAKAEDLVIDANSSKIINKTDTCSEGSCGGSYDKLNMTGGEFKIDRLNTDNDSVRFYFSDASTISGGKLTLSTPIQNNGANSRVIDLNFINGLTVAGTDTILDLSGHSRIRVDNQFNVTDATIYVHDAFQDEPIDGTGTINFTNVKTIVSNASFSPWDSGLSSDVTITNDEYNALPENQKAQYVKEQQQHDFYYKILKDPLTGKYFSAEDAKKYRLYEEIYHRASDFTINGGTLSVSKGSFSTDRNIITDGTEISLSNASYMTVAGEDEYSDGSLFNQELTFKGNSTVNVSGGSYIFTGHMYLPYQEADDYYLDNGLLTEAEMAKSAKPNEANANINIQDSTIITLNDTSAIALLDKNSGKINMTGGKINMNDSSSIYGALVVNGGELNVNGNNSIKNNLYITGNWGKDIYNGMGSILFWKAEGTAPAINLQSGAINLNGTLTADINATGGAISFNNNSALNGKITGQLNKLTIAGGTFNDENNLVIDGSEDITVSGGTIISNNRGAVLQHQGTGNIVVTGGTFNNNTEHEANDIVHLGDGDIKISGGTFNNSVIGKFVFCANGYGYETCSGSSTTPAAGKIEISGGVFNNAELNSDSTEGISISNGTFSDSSIAANNGDLIITGGSFKDNDLEGKNISIDSDKADLTLNAGKLLHSIDASRLTITGEKGISIAKTVVKSDDISGKIIANKDSFVGGFTEPLIRWNVSGTVLPTVQNSELTARNLTVNEAKIVLNADAKAGIGMIDWNPAADANGNYANGNVSYSYSKSLSDNEINTAVKMVADKILKIEATTKNIDDLGLAFNDALEAANVDGLPDSQYIEQQWKQGKSVDIDKIKTALREAYNNYNKFISESSAQVNVAKSTITMNGASGLVNGSAKDGNITVSDSTITANGWNDITAKTGTVSFANSKLIVSNGANLTVATKDGNTLNLTNGTVDLSGVLNGNVSGGTLAFNSANARLNGKIANTGVEINTDIGFSALPTGLTTLKIATGKTLDIGENSLTASTIAGGTISAILTDAAKNTAIVTAKASNVTLKLDMSQASRDEVTQYKITNGTGFTFGDYATNRYAVSNVAFGKNDAKTLEKLSGWNGGDLWILRLATASEAAIEDLEKSGVVLPENEKNASKILDLAAGILDKLPEHTQKVIEKVNNLLDKAAGKAEEVKQILKEIAPDASSSGAKTASNTAKSVISVINSRFGGSPRRGRSGGDYTVGQTAVWAQGMMNYAKLDTDNGFNAHSNGFAAGFEANFTDSFKAGVGYAYTSTDISTERSSTDVKTHTGFVYGEYKPNRAYINGVVSFGRSDYDDTTRSLNLTSDYKTDTIAAQVAAGYKAGVLTPEVAVRFTNVKQKAYTDAMGAKMADKTANTWTGVLGAKAGKDFVLKKANRKIGVLPELKVAATYDFARDDESRTVTLPDGSSYTATGEAMERFGVEAGAGVTVSIANSAEIALTYDGKFKKDYQDHTGMVNLKVKF